MNRHVDTIASYLASFRGCESAHELEFDLIHPPKQPFGRI